MVAVRRWAYGYTALAALGATPITGADGNVALGVSVRTDATTPALALPYHLFRSTEYQLPAAPRRGRNAARLVAPKSRPDLPDLRLDSKHALCMPPVRTAARTRADMADMASTCFCRTSPLP